jgi:GTPase SAR1 family protein
MKIIIGISGNQGSGKTTLAIEIAGHYKDINFEPTTISKTLKENGVLKLGDFNSFEEFLELQIKIYKIIKQQILSLDKDVFILDRTFVDIYVYTVSQINESAAKEMQNNPLLNSLLEEFLIVLLKEQQILFNFVIYIDEAITYTNEKTAKLRGSLNQIYLNKMLVIQQSIVSDIFRQNFVKVKNISQKNTIKAQSLTALKNYFNKEYNVNSSTT